MAERNSGPDEEEKWRTLVGLAPVYYSQLWRPWECAMPIMLFAAMKYFKIQRIPSALFKEHIYEIELKLMKCLYYSLTVLTHCFKMLLTPHLSHFQVTVKIMLNL